MTAFRLFSPFETFFDDAGKVAASGSLAFYEAGTTTPKDVYGEQALTTNNGSTIALGVDGKPVHDIWGDGSYRARLYASDGTLISDRDNLALPGGGGLTIPTLVDGQFLTNDAANLLWSAILQLPDPTGQNNKVLTAVDGAALWQAPDTPVITQPNTVVGSDSVKLSDGTNAVLFQKGSATAPASGSQTTTQFVEFGTAFTEIWWVGVSLTDASNSSVGFTASTAVLAKSLTGFTFSANISAHQGGSGNDANITSSINFDWIAWGKVSA